MTPKPVKEIRKTVEIERSLSSDYLFNLFLFIIFFSLCIPPVLGITIGYGVKIFKEIQDEPRISITRGNYDAKIS